MDENELRELNAIINDVWRFLKKYAATVSDKDEYWDALLAEGNALAEKHDSHKLCVCMIVACAKYLEGMVHHE